MLPTRGRVGSRVRSRYARIVQVILAVTDLERSLAFYESAFDWPRNARIDYANYVELHPPDGGGRAV
jgi:predicted enzyme related to lactoylglutathione lyase